jgi:hypothetical protein
VVSPEQVSIGGDAAVMGERSLAAQAVACNMPSALFG